MPTERSRLERLVAQVFNDDEPATFGSGWMSGTAGVFFGALAVGGVLDRIFGTQHLPPGQWPDAYGVEGRPVPEGWIRQLVFPFRK